MLTLYFGGLGARIYELDKEAFKVDAKAVHAILVIVIWMRLMRYYAVSSTLGM